MDVPSITADVGASLKTASESINSACPSQIYSSRELRDAYHSLTKNHGISNKASVGSKANRVEACLTKDVH